ncbi:eCIS core domain-containing protein [Rufibacter hautae]|uniref:DUF4157 domain-containing protein n=1 Tax=Rufibacter hautae TaxID=2595005 RepID=A0A5B6TE52_9BACT|nr:DUF4157 domain-containing protein [Rufibacter hautae]KAA3438747.1 DUF4157 domain-containing protein [Rufibacter hautae]
MVKTGSEKSSSAAVLQRSQQSPFFSKRGEDSFFASSGVQRSIEIGPPGDRYEQEADAMADKVLQQTPAAPAERQDQEKLQSKPLAQDISPVSRHQNPEEESTSLAEDGPPEISRKENATSTGETAPASPALEGQLNGSKGAGTPLPSKTRQEMEEGFGTDFSGVRTHTGPQAEQMSQDLGAQAFTHGQDIYFNSGKYSPETQAGKHLLAHELTHTVQQTGGGNVQKKGIVQRKDAVSEKKKFKEVPGKEIEENKAKDGSYLKKTRPLQFHINKLKLNKYLIIKEETAWLNQIKKPYNLPKGGERKTNQGNIWKSNVREGVREKLKEVGELKDSDIADTSKLYKFSRKKGKSKASGKGIIGTFTQIVNEVLVPFWDYQGTPKEFQIEHMIDYQVLGGDADCIQNLILLEREKNRKVGEKVFKSINTHLDDLIKHYNATYLNTGLPNSGKEVRKNYPDSIFVHGLNCESADLDIKDYYYYTELKNPKDDYNPYTKELIEIKEACIPENHFLLKTSDRKAGYIIPYTANDFKVGAFYLTVDYTDTVKSITFHNKLSDKKNAVGMEKKLKKKTLPINKEKKDVYVIQDSGEKQAIAPLLKGLFLKKASPIVINENDILFNGLDVSVKGKIDPTLSVLKGVDISFSLENEVFTVKADVPLNIISKYIPAPFKIDYSTISIEVSSEDGLSVAGGLGFRIGNLGQGDIFAKVGKTLGFEGTFSFDSRWFSKADISIAYDEDKWSIGGNLELKPDTITGLKSGKLTVGYKDKVFSAAGGAELTVPGVKTVTLAAEFKNPEDFKFLAEVTLSTLPGLKSGKVVVTLKAKEGEDLKLGVKGQAEPDLPNVPDLAASIEICYEDGIFDASATVKYKKGRFDGTIQVGVTNKTLNDKGEPKGEPDKTGKVTVFGYGELSVEVLKGIKGDLCVRLTPDKQVMVKGEATASNKKIFGEGYHPPAKELFPFPKLTIPLVGIPGLSISAFITGGVFFKFDWDPLVLKELKVGFPETNIKELEKVKLEIKGCLGSMANAELYMAITAGLEARVAIAKLTGELGGQAGLGLKAEAGGEIKADWSMDKGLQLKEVRAFMAVTPKAIFRLTGAVSVDLDLWVAKVNLYYHQWVLAEKELGMGNLGLKVDFPIKFDENNSLVLPKIEEMNMQKPDFKGDQGKEILDSAINGDAKKKLEEKKAQIRETIKSDLRNPETQKELTPTQYTNKMKQKYAKSPELQQFVVKTIEEESRTLEYEQFEKQKTIIRGYEGTLESKLSFLNVFTMWHQYVTQADVDAFKAELTKQDQEKKAQASLMDPAPATNAPFIGPPVAPTSTPVNKKAKNLQRKEAPRDEEPAEMPQARFMPVFKKPGPNQPPALYPPETEPAGGGERGNPSFFSPAEETSAPGEALSEEGAHESGYEYPESFLEEAYPGASSYLYNSPYGFQGATAAGNSPSLHHPLAPSFISNDMRVYSRRAKPHIKDQQPFFGGKEKASDTAHPFLTKSGVQRKKDTVRKAGEEEQKTQKPPEGEKKDKDAVQAKGKEDEQKLQKKPKAGTLQKEGCDKEVKKKAIRRKEKTGFGPVQKKEAENATVAPPSVEKKLQDSKGRGEALPPALLQELNTKMNFDFSGVRIHTDAEAVAMAEELGALAFTHGQDIYFNQGQYAPTTTPGRQLLVHELTHVMQQSPE